MTASWDYLAVAGIGLLAGGIELATRYRDEPVAAIASPPSLFYLLVNALASVLALWICRVFGWTPGIALNADPVKLRIGQTMLAGIGAMAVLRSSVLNVRLTHADAAFGPGLILQGLLRVADAAVDRHRGAARNHDVRIMDGVAFAKAAEALPAYCIGLMQNLSQEDVVRLATRVAEIRRRKVEDRIKSRLLGLAIIDLMGTRVLRLAVASLGDSIRP